jgi:hypothetical protein
MLGIGIWWLCRRRDVENFQVKGPLMVRANEMHERVSQPPERAYACAVAAAVANHLTAGDIDEVVAMLDSSIREVDGIGGQLADAWQQTVASLGSVTEIHPPVRGPGNARGRVVTVGIDCQHGPFQLRVRGIGQVLRTRSRTGIPT